MILEGVLIGFCGGFFGGLVGLGGGVLMIPLMVYVLRLPQSAAHGNSLAAIAFTAISGAVTYYIHGSVDPFASFFLALSAVLPVRYGAKLATVLRSDRLKKYFAIFVLFASFALILKDYRIPPSYRGGSFHLEIFLLLLTGSFTGFITGLFGVGGGTIMVPGLVMLLGMPQQVAQGTSLLAMVPVCLSGTLPYLRLGHMHLRLVIGLSLGATLGGPVGALLANFLPEFHLRFLFSFTLIFLAIKQLRE